MMASFQQWLDSERIYMHLRKNLRRYVQDNMDSDRSKKVTTNPIEGGKR